MIGQRFGRLVVLKKSERRGHNQYWLCRCDCGNEKSICQWSLKYGSSRSCGCLQRELVSARSSGERHWKKHGDSMPLREGRKRAKLYIVWFGMRYRCEKPYTRNYKWYGKRGISVCDEWADYSVFKEWALSHGYREGLTIDRIDNDGDYSPDNCRFLTSADNVRRQHREVSGGEVCHY